MKVSVIAMGRGRDGSENVLFRDYARRLPWKVELIELGERHNRRGALLNAAPDDAFLVALDGGGKALSSEGLAEKFSNWQHDGHGHIAFLIGGADGHEAALLQRADFVLSLGAMTWPHLLVRAMLAEQIYRAYSIMIGHPYHRA